MRPTIPLGLALLALPVHSLGGQSGAPTHGGILLVEDRRAPSREDVVLLENAARGGDVTLMVRGIRALGRLERPPVGVALGPLLSHWLPAVRGAAADALAQSIQAMHPDSAMLASGSEWSQVVELLTRAAASEGAPQVQGMLALALGRIPYPTAEARAAARVRLVVLSLRTERNPDAAVNVTRAVETIIRKDPRRHPVEEPLLERLRVLARRPEGDPRLRRHALGALLAAGQADLPTLASAADAPDEQLRRLAVSGLDRLAEGNERGRLLARSLGDKSSMVRLEAVRARFRSGGAAACGDGARLVGDAVPQVALAAIDLLRRCAGDSRALRALERRLSRSGADWRSRAHAIVALAAVSPERAGAMLPRVASDSLWEVRQYAARAAAALRDTATLRRLARDGSANVREAAVTGLKEVAGHADDAFYRRSLGSEDGAEVIAAALALAATPARRDAIEALVPALERITRERRETSRDPRLALLARIRELGDSTLTPRLTPLLVDFDPVVAESAATILTQWTGRVHHPAPERLSPVEVTFEEAEGLRGFLLRFTMESGGTFDVAFDLDDAPVAAVRIAQLARRGFYDGLTWHRMVPNFVLQGGSPGANEYAGDGPFIRDELGVLTHARGTLGLSTRG
ncbi:MAG: hypothetical protein HOP28_03375, partial [Gemmatimonadales bacterium]|nr:hypothetical protein [Gemmatimonadales bacterium]